MKEKQNVNSNTNNNTNNMKTKMKRHREGRGSLLGSRVRDVDDATISWAGLVLVGVRQVIVGGGATFPTEEVCDLVSLVCLVIDVPGAEGEGVWERINIQCPYRNG